MKPFYVVSLAAIFVASSLGQALAEDSGDQDYARPGFYLLGGVAIGFENSDDLDDFNKALGEFVDDLIDLSIAAGDLPPGTTGSGKIDVAALPGVNLAGGYRLTPRFAVEGEFEWAQGDIDLDIDLEAPGLGEASDSLKIGEFSYWLLSANAKVFALTGRFQPFALIGIGVMSQEIDFSDDPNDTETGAGFRFGGGADVYITPKIALQADFTYVLSAGDLKDNDVMSLNAGLIWRF